MTTRQGEPVEEVSFVGGSRVGWVNASWPLAKLTARAHQLRLAGFGTYEFTEQDVVSFEHYGFIPIFASGIRIIHNRTDYPAKIVFWCMGSRASVLEKIRAVGFRPLGTEVPRSSGFAIRWSVAILAILLWNVLFFADHWLKPLEAHPLRGPFALLALLAMFAISSALPRSVALQHVVLEPGHSIGEIKPFLRLLQIVTGFLSVGLVASLLFRHV